MKYIAINREDLSIALVDQPGEQPYSVPAKMKYFRRLSPLEKKLYEDILCAWEYERLDPEGRGLLFPRLIEPDPWLVAIAYIMWQGILQGLAWDAVRPLIRNALRRLRSWQLAPQENAVPSKITAVLKPLQQVRSLLFGPSKPSQRDRTGPLSQTEVGFCWEEYSFDENKMRRLFIGLRQIQSDMPDAEIDRVSNTPPYTEG